MSKRNTSPPFIYWIFVYLLFSLVGCSTPRGVLTSQKDSVRTVITERIVYRDSLVYVPVPAESDNAKLEATDTSRLSTSLAESEAYVSDGVLHHSLRNKPDALIPININLPNKVHTTERTSLSRQIVTVEVERELTTWQRLLLMLGQGTFVVLLGIILYIILKIVRKLR